MAPAPWITKNVGAAIRSLAIPAMTTWNRLEGRPRTTDFRRALAAEVRDPLWMLTRQWQLGEFHGDDAGSPVLAKLHLTATRLTKLQPDGHAAEPFDDGSPLESRVEARPVPLIAGGRDIALDLRLLMGRHWLRMLSDIGDFRSEFADVYPIHEPDPDDVQDAVYTAHPDTWSAFAAVAGRCMDGAKLYLHLKAGGAASEDVGGLSPHEAEIDARGAPFVAWFERLIHQPADADAWIPDRLEYQVRCSAPLADGEQVLSAEEYYHGHLDWYSFDIDPELEGLGPAEPEPPATHTGVMLPTPLSFEGMPNTRWWTFEDGRTNFGDVRPDTTDLGKLLLVEFALIYANDWFIVPYVLPAGSIARVGGLAVTNVFGERTWIEAAGAGPDDDWQRWAMFNLTTAGEGGEQADTSLALLPTAPAVLEGRPVEEVLLIRDEMANMVWGVERTIPAATGIGRPGAESAAETRAYFERELERRLGAPPEPPPFAEGAAIRYDVMSSVPEHWIPFVPVHIDGDIREIQLQRGAMPRILIGDPDAPRKVRPRTALLREGLDAQPAQAYFVHEEEVPRAGVRVTQAFQRTRWRDGRAWVWLGARKRTGRGEASSGLAFDRIVDRPR